MNDFLAAPLLSATGLLAFAIYALIVLLVARVVIWALGYVGGPPIEKIIWVIAVLLILLRLLWLLYPI